MSCVITKSNKLHTSLEEFENTALISPVRRPTVHTNPAPKHSSNQRNLNTSVLHFSVDEKHFENEAFS